ncbi:MAG: cytochrome C oxidase subunit IV family protein [Desulfobacterales bacterium]|nr:cytochrome C oxidase subunit IV family protein [Desulfobacterales bacterium]
MEDNGHIFSYRTLFLVLMALLVLTGVTVGASYVDLGRFNVWMALGIASVKGSLVLLVFMHMIFEGRALIISFLSTIGFLAIMIGFTFWDIAFR